MNKNQNSLIVAIIFASVVVSGSLVFLSFQLGNGGGTDDLQTQITAGIENYIQKQEEASTRPTVVKGVSADNDPVLGNPNAQVTIVEFSDYQCPFCRKFYNETFPTLKEKYIDTGKANLVYRDFPLSFHKAAIPAAAAAECIRTQTDDKTYFEFHDKIYDGQNLLGNGTVDIPDGSLVQYAQELGVNIAQFNDCRANEDVIAEVTADLQDGTKYGVGGTPAFFINGTFIEGAQPIQAFEQIIEAELSKNR